MQWKKAKLASGEEKYIMTTKVECISATVLAGEDICIALVGGNVMPKSIGKKFKITFVEVV